jgi:4-hydroxybenzoate polyprenyltransferase
MDAADMTVQTTALAGVTGARQTIAAYVAASRPRHWLKNILVFLPIVAAHRLYEAHLLWRGLGAFVAFSLCASSIYLFNDL